MQTISDEGISLIKFLEGLRLHAYRCDAGVWTIGYGETGKHVVPGMKLANEREADARLRARLAKECEPAVRRLVRVPLSQKQFDALVSLSFNIGVGAFQKSTLLRKLNAGDVAGAAEQFKVWKCLTDPKTGVKRESQGLINRRVAERAFFEGNTTWREEYQAHLNKVKAQRAATKKA
ncbi:lysozyme [Xylella fastidiosa]|uniref:lysozyme n=1 Tax=Xylella fastidiosa TaxID=2371 RepID=UPI0003F56AE9|nr:lysozyme [Xylella fastidiosa]ALQ96701.1 lysozyme [Xylella fastidiosa]